MKRGALFLALLTLLPTFSRASQSNSAAVVSANPHSTNVGISILKSGGNAADAVIATAFALAVTEPQNSGLGGGGLLIYYDKSTNRYSYFEYLPIAPFEAHSKIEDLNPKVKKNTASQTGPLSVGIPGFLLGLDKIHKRHGHLPWSKLVEPAASLANKGFTVTDKLRHDINQQKDRLKDQKQFQDIFVSLLEDKKATLIQKNLGHTLSKVANSGAQSFYKESLSKIIIKELEDENTLITAEDLSTYKVIVTKPKQFIVKNNVITTAAHPSIGGPFLEFLIKTSLKNKISSKSSNWTKFLETATKDYINEAQQKISHTTHISVIDKQGNIASMTNSLNDVFGSGILLPGTGILLNNIMDNYDYNRKEISYDIKRKVRPNTNLTPTIVFQNFQPILVIGTSGGSTIPSNLYQVIQRSLFDQEKLGRAIQAPKFYTFPQEKLNLYEKGFPAKLLSDKFSFKTNLTKTSAGNIQAISSQNGKLKVFSDPRGDGVGVVLKLKP